MSNKKCVLRVILLGGLLLTPVLAQPQIDMWGALHAFDTTTVRVDTVTFLYGLRHPIVESAPGWICAGGETAGFHFSPIDYWPDRGVSLLTYFGSQPVVLESIIPICPLRWITLIVTGGMLPDSFAVCFDERLMVGLTESKAELVRGNRIAAAPNPFRVATAIHFSLPAAADAELTILNPAGVRVRTLRKGRLAAGTHDVVWNALDDGGRPVESGVYFCRLSSAGLVTTGKLILNP